MLDGEIVCLDAQGRSDFRTLLTRTGQTAYCAFDLLELDGRDLQGAPLEARKLQLDTLPTGGPSRLLVVDHVEATGRALFDVACAHDLEGVVGKWRHGRYVGAAATSSWVTVTNPTYSTRAQRRDLVVDAAQAQTERPVRLVLE